MEDCTIKGCFEPATNGYCSEHSLMLQRVRNYMAEAVVEEEGDTKIVETREPALLVILSSWLKKQLRRK